MKRIELDVSPLVNEAIGSLADLAGTIGWARREIAKLRNKRMWTLGELEKLEGALKDVADVLRLNYKEWEEASGVKISEAKARLKRMEER